MMTSGTWREKKWSAVLHLLPLWSDGLQVNHLYFKGREEDAYCTLFNPFSASIAYAISMTNEKHMYVK